MDYQNFSTFHPEGGGIVYLLLHIWILHLILPLVTHQKYINISTSLQDTQGRRLKNQGLGNIFKDKLWFYILIHTAYFIT